MLFFSNWIHFPSFSQVSRGVTNHQPVGFPSLPLYPSNETSTNPLKLTFRTPKMEVDGWWVSFSRRVIFRFQGEYRIPKAQGIPATCTSTAAGNGTGKSSAVARPANLAATWQQLVVVVWGADASPIEIRRLGALTKKGGKALFIIVSYIVRFIWELICDNIDPIRRSRDVSLSLGVNAMGVINSCSFIIMLWPVAFKCWSCSFLVKNGTGLTPNDLTPTTDSRMWCSTFQPLQHWMPRNQQTRCCLTRVAVANHQECTYYNHHTKFITTNDLTKHRNCNTRTEHFQVSLEAWRSYLMEEDSTHPEHILDWDPQHTAYNVSTSPRLLVVWCGNTVHRMIHVYIHIYICIHIYGI